MHIILEKILNKLESYSCWSAITLWFLTYKFKNNMFFMTFAFDLIKIQFLKLFETYFWNFKQWLLILKPRDLFGNYFIDIGFKNYYLLFQKLKNKLIYFIENETYKILLLKDKYNSVFANIQPNLNIQLNLIARLEYCQVGNHKKVTSSKI